VVVSNSMLTGLCKEGSITEALQIFELMKNKDHHSQTWPDPDYKNLAYPHHVFFSPEQKEKGIG